jgi:hypothetical protein
MKNRAIEDWQKRDVMEKILAVWLENPSLRLSQLIVNSIDVDTNLYIVEDYDLVENVSAFSERYNKKIPIND